MKKYQELIDRLTPIEECEYGEACGCGKNAHIKPILIGDVLEKCKQKKILHKLVLDFGIEQPYGQTNVSEYLNILLEEFDMTKSLQEILESEVEVCKHKDFNQVFTLSDTCTCNEPQLKPEAKELFDFILELKLV